MHLLKSFSFGIKNVSINPILFHKSFFKSQLIFLYFYASKTILSFKYGVPIAECGWGGSGNAVSFATANYYANKFSPDIIAEYVYKGLNYIFGCHPYLNISFVSSVGTISKKVTYGNNRANFSFIAGGMVPGLLLIKPDFLENKEDWPFFWGENEVTVGGCADYIFLANAAGALAGGK